jgi:hypothetical protein
MKNPEIPNTMYNIIGRFRKRGWIITYNEMVTGPQYAGVWCPQRFIPEGTTDILVRVPVQKGTWTFDPALPVYAYVFNKVEGRKQIIFEAKGEAGQETFDAFLDWLYDLLDLSAVETY